MTFDELDFKEEKYIITLTKEDFSTDNIKQINIFDFLIDDNF